MQNAVPKGKGGMLAVLGSTIEDIEKILQNYSNEFLAQIANDNSDGQIVLSGKNNDLEKLTQVLKEKNIKNIKLPVSAPFHCELMENATQIMKKEIEKVNFNNAQNKLISNVTATEILNQDELKRLLIVWAGTAPHPPSWSRPKRPRLPRRKTRPPWSCRGSKF